MKEKERFTRRGVLKLGAVVLGSVLTGGAVTTLGSKENYPTPALTETSSPTESPTQTSTPEPTKEATPEPTKEATQTPEQPKVVEIIVTGDVMLGRFVEGVGEGRGDLNYPLRKVAPTLREADIVFINLESPIVEGCPESKSLDEMVFCAEPKMVGTLFDAKVGVASGANNHFFDHGQKGVDDTHKYLNEAGISVTGHGELVKRTINGNSFGFLGMDFQSKLAQENDFEIVRKANREVDALIVSVHWGAEYAKNPTELQKKWARKLVEAGADFVVGHHPHVIQPKEIINGVPVYYSVGNLSMDQMWPETIKGLVLRLIFHDGRLASYEELPTEMKSWAQPEFINQESHNETVNLKEYSSRMIE